MEGLEAGGGLTLGSPPKEHEPLKLFVGQVPKTVEEPELRAIFEPFGAIHELIVLKDRTTGAHKGTALPPPPLLCERIVARDIPSALT